MLAIPAILLYAVSYAAAYMVLVPNQSQGWTNVGNQTLTWSRVDTDPLNFTVVLVNQASRLSFFSNPGKPLYISFSESNLQPGVGCARRWYLVHNSGQPS